MSGACSTSGNCAPDDTDKPMTRRHVQNLVSHGRHAGMAVLCLAVLGGSAGCRREAPASTPPPETPYVETLTRGPVSLRIEIAPPVVHLEQDTLVTLTLERPTGIRVHLPSLTERVRGFLVNETFDRPSTSQGGDRWVEVRRIRLTPTLAPEYRLAPLAVIITNEPGYPPVSDWFSTPPIRLKRHVATLALDQELRSQVDPVRIRPSTRTLVLWTVGIILLLALVLLLAWWLRRVREEVKLRRVSPRERALRELDRLLAGGLLDHDRIKDFYVELTMVVRRYIERQYAVRAPEQTTDEFLADISRRNLFPSATTNRLQAFLEAADRVKFAAFVPDSTATRDMVETARNYLVSDHPQDTPEGGPHHA